MPPAVPDATNISSTARSPLDRARRAEGVQTTNLLPGPSQSLADSMIQFDQSQPQSKATMNEPMIEPELQTGWPAERRLHSTLAGPVSYVSPGSASIPAGGPESRAPRQHPVEDRSRPVNGEPIDASSEREPLEPTSAETSVPELKEARRARPSRLVEDLERVPQPESNETSESDTPPLHSEEAEHLAERGSLTPGLRASMAATDEQERHAGQSVDLFRQLPGSPLGESQRSAREALPPMAQPGSVTSPLISVPDRDAQPRRIGQPDFDSLAPPDQFAQSEPSVGESSVQLGQAPHPHWPERPATETKLGEVLPAQPREPVFKEAALSRSPSNRSHHAPTLTINRLDVQIINQAPVATAQPEPLSQPVSRSPDSWDILDRHHLGRFYLTL
jgi:hypothetical protein